MPLIRTPGAEAPQAVGVSGDAAAVLLTTGAPEERWAAARRLGEQAGAAELLGPALWLERDPRVREAIFTSLVRQGGDASVRAILPHIRSEDASLRTGALDALRALPQALAPHMPSVLGDPDPDVRLLTCDLARALDPVLATGLLCDLLVIETQVNVCAAAVDALAELGGPEALPSLAQCADRFPGEPFLQFAIKVASERIGLGRAVGRD